MANKSVLFKIKRQASPNSEAYWEEFELAWRPGLNVISLFMEVAVNPVTRDGKPTDSDQLRFQLSGGSLRLLRHAD